MHKPLTRAQKIIGGIIGAVLLVFSAFNWIDSIVNAPDSTRELPAKMAPIVTTMSAVGPAVIFACAILLAVFLAFEPILLGATWLWRSTPWGQTSVMPPSPIVEKLPSTLTVPYEKTVAPVVTPETKVTLTINANELIQKFHDLTNYEINRVKSDYLGKWITCAGTVFNSTSVGKLLAILINPEAPASMLDAISARFGEGEINTVTHLRKGDALCVHGQIVDIETHMLYLESCVVVYKTPEVMP